jgi:hypothetical protein
MSTSYNKNTNGAVVAPLVEPTKSENKTMAQPVANPNAAYAGITEAKTDSRYPFLNAQGKYLVVTKGWRLQTNQDGRLADVWDMEILHTYQGAAQAGETYTRMRVKDQYATWLNEILARAVTLLSILGGEPVSPKSVDVPVISGITAANGSAFFGTPVVIELLPPAPTKGGKMFSALHYHVPTAADLEAARIHAPAAPARVVAAPAPAPVVAAPVAVQAAPAELDDFGTLLSLGWSEAEINGLDDIAFGTAVDGKVVRSTVTLSANGQSFAAAAPARRSRVAPGASA